MKHLLSFLLAFAVALAVNPDCALIVPQHPLTAAGLATPYLLTALNPANGPCHQSNPDQSTFVQSTIIDIDTGNLFVYNPLVIDAGSTPAIPPVVPKLPTNYVIGIWFGTNADTITLKGNNGSLIQGNCVNGVFGSVFGQFAFCNANRFFSAANAAIFRHQITVPPLKTAKDGFTCPTSRDFFIVDQDQSDNLPVSYLVTSKGKIAQNTAANAAALSGETTISNGSDEGLVVLVDNAFGCAPWEVTDLANPGHTAPSLALNELQAAAYQKNPALVPAGDPMVLVNGNPNLIKLDAYRIGVNQFPAFSLQQASTVDYCVSFTHTFTSRFSNPTTKSLLTAAPSADNVSPNLYVFMANRFINSYGPDGLNCAKLLGLKCPITVSGSTVSNLDLMTPLVNDIVGSASTMHISLFAIVLLIVLSL